MYPSVVPTTSPTAVPTSQPTGIPTAAPTYVPHVLVKGVLTFSGNELVPFTAEKSAKLVSGVAAATGVANAEVSIARVKRGSVTSNFFENQVTVNLVIKCPDQSHADSISTIMSTASFPSFFISTLAQKEGLEVAPGGLVLKQVSTQKIKVVTESDSSALATSFAELFAIVVIFFVFMCVLKVFSANRDTAPGDENDTLSRKKKDKGYGALKSAQRVYSTEMSRNVQHIVVPSKATAKNDEADDWERDKAVGLSTYSGDDFEMDDV
jgi:hypothetical protein